MLAWLLELVCAVVIMAAGTATAALAEEQVFSIEQNMGLLARVSAEAGRHAAAVLDVLAAVPSIPQDFASAITAILRATPAGLHPAVPMVSAVLISALALTVPRLLERAGGTWLERKRDRGERFERALRWIAFDAIAFLLAVALASLLVNLVLNRQLMIGQLAVTLVGAAVRWRLSMLVPEILVRPTRPELRLLPVSDEQARLVMTLAGGALGVGLLFITAAPVLLQAGLPMRTAQAMALLVGTAMAIGGAYGVYRFFGGMRRALAAFSEAAVLLIWFAWSASVVSLDFDIYHGIVWSLAIAAATFGIDRLLALGDQPAMVNGKEMIPSSRRHLVIGTLRRIVLAVAGTLVAGLIAHLWLVDLLGVVDNESWVRVRYAVITALAVLVAGYVLYEVFRAWAQAKFGIQYGGPSLDRDEELTPASRLSSVLPVLQAVLGAVIIATAVLLALSHLGINVAPLIAGAGIFGLAISFGSQALVRDIVAGLFYLFDDAFRVGEYIAAGKYKGTVERIALRSVRLRHQNGQIHTIPYGQLGAVTNFSRDYQTIKFNLRLARDTDVEKVRKLSKKLGQQLLEDPEIGKEFLQPFKMQGVADIQENALVCRFKFTARPARPTLVQREILKRLYRLFTEQGVGFASNAVVVQTTPGTAQVPVSPQLAAGASISRADVETGERLAS